MEHTNIWWETRTKYLEPYMEYEEWLIGQILGRGIVTVKYVGSYKETIASLHYADSSSDLDMMYIYKDFIVSPNYTSNTHLQIKDSSTPGYVFLQVCQSKEALVRLYQKIADKGSFHKSLKVDELMKYFGDKVIGEFDSGTGLCVSSEAFVAMHEKFNRMRFSGWLTFQQKGPASKIFWNIAGLPLRVKISPMDIVFALHSDNWPNQANEWLSRERPHDYLHSSLIGQIKNYGVDLVAKSSYLTVNKTLEYYHSFEWRLSLSVAETLLVKTWTRVQKSCYRTVKTLHTDYLSSFGVTSYSIKNIMFWLIEESPPEIWTHERLMDCIEIFLSRIGDCCRQHACPHYFVKKNNLFAGSEPQGLMKAAKICDKLISDFYGQLWISDGLWFRISARKMVPYFYSLQYDRDLAEVFHQRQIQSNLQKLPYLKFIFKIYYSSKIQKQTSQMLLNSESNQHFSSQDVVSAVETYIEHYDLLPSSRSVEADVLYSQILWVYAKMLRWVSEKGLKCTTELSADKIIHTLQNCLHDEGKLTAIADKLIYGRNLTKSEIEIIQNFSKSLKTELATSGSIPVVICALDSIVSDITFSRFSYKGMACHIPKELFFSYYCSRILTLKSERFRSETDLDVIWKRCEDTWNYVATNIHKQFLVILVPLATHLYQTMKQK